MKISIRYQFKPENIADQLRLVAGFPQYVSGNWDSIEECLFDFAEICDGRLHIVNIGDISFNSRDVEVYFDILNSLKNDFPNVVVDHLLSE